MATTKQLQAVEDKLSKLRFRKFRANLGAFSRGEVGKVAKVAAKTSAGGLLVVGTAAFLAARLIQSEKKKTLKAIDKQSKESRKSSELLRRQIKKVRKKGFGKRVTRATTIRK